MVASIVLMGGRSEDLNVLAKEGLEETCKNVLQLEEKNLALKITSNMKFDVKMFA